MKSNTSIYKKENLRTLRRYLKLTQKQFIERFLVDNSGNPTMSIATFSNLEAKSGARLSEVIREISDKLQVDAMIFTMNSDEFIDKLDLLLPNERENEFADKSEAKKETINQLIHRLTLYFAERILNHDLKKGDKIPSDRILATEMNVGRSTIREALKVLDVLGMIDIRPGQGTYISNHESDFFVIPLSWSLFLNGSQTENIVATRNLIQMEATKQAAMNKDEDFLNELNGITRKIHVAYMEQNYKEFLEGDVEFHLCIAKGSKNILFYSITQTISNLMRYISQTGMVDQVQLKEIYEEHSRVYGLILAGDPEKASQAMEYHLEKSKERYNYR